MSEPTEPSIFPMKRCADCRVLNPPDAARCRSCQSARFEDLGQVQFFGVGPASRDSAEMAEGEALQQPEAASTKISDATAGPTNVGHDGMSVSGDASNDDALRMRWLIVILISAVACLVVATLKRTAPSDGLAVCGLIIVVAAVLTSRGRLEGFFLNLISIVATIILVSISLSLGMFLAICISCLTQ